MVRPFDFKTPVQNQARIRQHGLCAVQGEKLDFLVEHAHHVIPNQSGDAASEGHRWLAEVDNCVIICDQCHERVHENGNYRSGAVAPPSYFPFSHGPNAAAHMAWAARLELKSRGIWS